MRAYLWTTGAVFGLLTVAHIWRMMMESNLVREPTFIIVTLVSAALCVWAGRLIRATAR